MKLIRTATVRSNNSEETVPLEKLFSSFNDTIKSLEQWNNIMRQEFMLVSLRDITDGDNKIANMFRATKTHESLIICK